MTGVPFAFPPIIGHRGAAGLAPENTLAGFREAARLGVSWVEFDVRLSKDGVAFLSHDAVPRRTTGYNHPVGETAAADLAALDAGVWFGPAFRGEGMPRLGEALPLAADLGLGIDIELKSAPGREKAMAAMVAEVLRQHWPKAGPPAMVASFDTDMIQAARERLPQLPRAWIIRKLPRDWEATADALGCAMIHIGARQLSERDVAAVKKTGRGVAVFTVNTPALARRLWGWGVDSVFSDRPDLLLPSVGDE